MPTQPPTTRAVQRLARGLETSDGAGVRLNRVIGRPGLEMLDPFLMLDAFRSDDPEDYIAGFPPHPHRGFETVTYLLAGRMRHRDSAGHTGVLESGGVQWMTAGRGVIHSEMPEQENGLLYGFQLWVNLPAEKKMGAPRYQEFAPDSIPLEPRVGARVRVIAGTTTQGTTGPVKAVAIEPLYLDVTLDEGATFHERLPEHHSAFIYVIAGTLRVAGTEITQDTLAVLSEGEQLTTADDGAGARFLLVSGRPLREPVARRGPFVMNTQTELTQAFRDYEEGRFAIEPDRAH